MGILLIDKDLVHPKKGHHSLHAIPFTDIAFKKFGRKIMAMVVLGYMTALLNLTSKKAIIQAIRENAPSGTGEINVEAFQEGYRLGIKNIKNR